MKGTLIHTDKGWSVLYEDDKGTYSIDVKPGRIDDLNRVGTHLQVNSEVDFTLEDVSYFPYRYAVPYIDSDGYSGNTKSAVTMRTKKQHKITLWLVGFPTDEVEVICDSWDTSSNGYFYFYDEVEGRRKLLCLYPVERTAFHEMETIETEY